MTDSCANLLSFVGLLTLGIGHIGCTSRSACHFLPKIRTERKKRKLHGILSKWHANCNGKGRRAVWGGGGEKRRGFRHADRLAPIFSNLSSSSVHGLRFCFEGGAATFFALAFLALRCWGARCAPLQSIENRKRKSGKHRRMFQRLPILRCWHPHEHSPTTRSVVHSIIMTHEFALCLLGCGILGSRLHQLLVRAERAWAAKEALVYGAPSPAVGG